MSDVLSLPSWLHDANDGADSLIDITLSGGELRHAIRESRLIGEADGRLLVQLGFDATNDNAALSRFLAEALGVPAAQISVVGGGQSVRKTVRLAGVGQRQALLCLAP